LPACTHCLNYKTECVFTQVEKKRNPPKGAKYIEGLENRLGRMESLLRLSGMSIYVACRSQELGLIRHRVVERGRQWPNGFRHFGETTCGEEGVTKRLSSTGITTNLAHP
jgi:hypothetical protein